MSEKEELRQKMKKRLSKQKVSERRKKSSIIQKRLFKQTEFLASKCIMLYVSKGTGEVETGPIIKKALSMGKKVALPVTLVKEGKLRPERFNGRMDSLKKGSYSIYEPSRSTYKRPISTKEIDLVVVPGLAFDRDNDRLGHGKGYYDRFLKTLDSSTPTIGLGFDFQMFKRIPTSKNDITLTNVITN
ncbi:MAG: 5-formyltetrahydrofolate cyclo-ligase [Candidatus Omnitrophota bacterium]